MLVRIPHPQRDMDSFFEKLKKGMGTEETPMADETPLEAEELSQSEEKQISSAVEKPQEEPQALATEAAFFTRRSDISGSTPKNKAETAQRKKSSSKRKEKAAGTTKKKKIAITEELQAPSEGTKKTKRGWFEQEGELTIDMYQTHDELVIQSAIAGVKPEDLDVTIEKDMVTIKGERERQFVEESENFFHQECYWGRFSRQVLVPVDIDASRAQATIKEGILTIRIPVIEQEKTRKVTVKG